MDNTIIVGSLGRSGSTALYQSIGQTIKYSLTDFQSNLNSCQYNKGYVYKTHDFPPDNPPEHTKFIWTFSDPYEIVLSVLNQENEKGMQWIKNHFDHLNGEFSRYDDILDYDAFHLEEHFDKWYKQQDFDLLTIKYRDIWKKQRQLSRFVGNNVDLPIFSDREDRFSKLDKDKKKRIKNTYGELHSKVNRADNFKIW